MNTTDIITLITTVGFPIVACGFYGLVCAAHKRSTPGRSGKRTGATRKRS